MAQQVEPGDTVMPQEGGTETDLEVIPKAVPVEVDTEEIEVPEEGQVEVSVELVEVVLMGEVQVMEVQVGNMDLEIQRDTEEVTLEVEAVMETVTAVTLPEADMIPLTHHWDLGEEGKFIFLFFVCCLLFHLIPFLFS